MLAMVMLGYAFACLLVKLSAMWNMLKSPRDFEYAGCPFCGNNFPLVFVFWPFFVAQTTLSLG